MKLLTAVRFETDGIRGEVPSKINEQVAYKLGRAICKVFGNIRVVVGMDTRESGVILSRALMTGLRENDIETDTLGVMPTPGIARIAKELGAIGVSITASHNPAKDNGLKVFLLEGTKISDEIATEIEAFINSDEADYIAEVTDDTVNELLRQRYIDFIMSQSEPGLLEGMHIAIDAANGAASTLAPEIFASLGMEVDSLFCSPDGQNINENCGATSTDALVEYCKTNSVIGAAFDGDADRVKLVTESGRVVDGDRIMLISAIAMKEEGLLKNNEVVGTIMSNTGFKKALEAHGITLKRAKVGDRFVTEMMEKLGCNLGGEQAGHVIYGDLAESGDGMQTLLQVMQYVKKSGQTLDWWFDKMEDYPQKLVGLEVPRALATHPMVVDKTKEVENYLGDNGNVSVRASGTEELVRIMVEAPTQAEAERLCGELSDFVFALAA